MLNPNQSVIPGRLQQYADITQSLHRVLGDEADAITHLIGNLPDSVFVLIDKVLAVSGKIVFSGLGKSGLVGQKLAATWSSLGIPSIYLHPTEALHGDVGVVQPNDFFMVLSKSGTGGEFEYLLPVLASRGIPTALVCCNEGHLADKVDLVVCLPFTKEACSFNLAPTSSSTMMMALGDAIAIAISDLKNFTHHDFARHHPAGALGKKLLLTVRSLMHSGISLPFISPTTHFKDLLFTITSKKLGLGIVVDDQQKLMGIITDGDLRRACEKGPSIFSTQAVDFMTRHPKTVDVATLAYVALEVMEDFNITSLVVMEGDRAVGLVHIHDLIKAGIRG